MTEARTAPTSRPPGTPTRLAGPAAALAAVVGAFAYVAAHDPNDPGHYPVCPLLQLTGVYCPGCGGLRAAHAVAHGDPATAFATNALVLAGILGFALFWIHWAVRAARARPVAVPVRPVHLWVVAGLCLTFTVIRNTPLGAALAP